MEGRIPSLPSQTSKSPQIHLEKLENRLLLIKLSFSVSDTQPNDSTVILGCLSIPSREVPVIFNSTLFPMFANDLAIFNANLWPLIGDFLDIRSSLMVVPKL